MLAVHSPKQELILSTLLQTRKSTNVVTSNADYNAIIVKGKLSLEQLGEDDSLSLPWCHTPTALG